MTGSEYWLQREKEWIAARNRKTDKLSEDLENAFLRASDDLQKEIAAWVEKYADAEGITLADARKRLSIGELQRLKMNLEEFTKLAKDNADGRWEKELTSASASVHVTRLQALELQMKNIVRKLYAGQESAMSDFLTGLYADEREHMTYEIQRAKGKFDSLAALPEDRVQKILQRPWADDGQTFSERLWGTQNKLINVMQSELLRGIISGKDTGSIGKSVAKRMGAASYAGVRLIQTETTRLIVESDKDTFEEMGIDQVEVVETLDRSTCDICSALDGQTMKRSEASAGSTAPPFHTNCRGILVPHDVELSKDGHRTARDPESGKSIEIQDMAFKDWDAVYVKKTRTLQEVKAERERAGGLEAGIRKRIEKIDLSTCSLDEVLSIGRDVESLFNISGHLGDKAYLKDVFGKFRKMGGEIAPAQFAKGSFKRNKEMLTEAFSYYPAAWVGYLEKNGIQIYTRKTFRGFFAIGARKANGYSYQTSFEHYADKFVSIYMNGVRKTTPFHEIGHMIEFFNPDALRISKMFIEKRVGDEAPVRLRRIFPLSGYSLKEITRPDDFISPYIGKSYRGASEVLSIGLEQIFEPTDMLKKIDVIDGRSAPVYATIKDDKEYLNLIIGMILTA